MEARPSPLGSLTSVCSTSILDCLSPVKKDYDEVSVAPRIGVEREMKIMFHQPDIIPPMKLTIFDDLPSTPRPTTSSQLSQWMTQGRNLASRASERASSSMKKRTPSKLHISDPQPLRQPEFGSLRRTRHIRPLELSIYLPENRLSDLPRFDRLSFTEFGEIKFPPPAVIRPHSEDVLQTFVPEEPLPRKPASMFEHRRRSHIRRETTSTVISTSRPASEHDALHSHPISWISLPGLPPQTPMGNQSHFGSRIDNSVTILSPMQEEFTPPASAVDIDGVVLTFPKLHPTAEESTQNQEDVPVEDIPAPWPKIGSAVLARPKIAHPNEAHSPSTYFHQNYQTQKQISQWLGTRSHSSSISTVKTASTSTSFAEHRRKRSQFYQLSTPAIPPRPIHVLNLQHKRTMTESTVASTVNTDILSFETINQSQESITTAPDIASRTGTIKSVSTLNHHTVCSKAVIDHVPELPPSYSDAVHSVTVEKCRDVDIGRALTTPGVGRAF